VFQLYQQVAKAGMPQVWMPLPSSFLSCLLLVRSQYPLSLFNSLSVLREPLMCFGNSNEYDP
jgi:hypothetical protein